MKKNLQMLAAKLASLFVFEGRVDRKSYFLAGFFLMILKYMVEASVIYVATGLSYSPLDFVNPLLSSRVYFSGPSASWLGMAWIVWSLPFFWIAVAMSIRRASDIGLSPWFGMAILVPIMNWLGMFLMSVLPSKERYRGSLATETHKSDEELLADTFRKLSPELFPPTSVRHLSSKPPTIATAMSESVEFEKKSYDGVSAAVLGIGAGAMYAIAMVLFSVYALGSYGAAMFFGTPVVAGAIASYLYNLNGPKPIGQTIGHALLTILFACCGFLCVGIEGVICVAMALPIMVPLGLFGSLIGVAIAMATANRHRDDWSGMAGCMIALPIIAMVEPQWQSRPLFEVMTSVEIQATPETVWREVIEFPEITTEQEWFFAMGIASPLRARIEGEGVGAIRHCEFTTGAFVEPITVWNPPFQLAFDVTEQPDPMVELTPYRHLHPPHLEHSFRSTKGEFRLVDIGNDRTRLEGRTWYQLEIHPLGYWSLWTDWIVHRIHLRVLTHIQKISESKSK